MVRKGEDRGGVKRLQGLIVPPRLMLEQSDCLVDCCT